MGLYHYKESFVSYTKNTRIAAFYSRIVYNKDMKLKHIWLILAAYGVWFAILSGLEQVFVGNYWKFALSLILGVVTYWIIEQKLKEK